MELPFFIPWYWIGFAAAASVILVFNVKYPWKVDGKTVHAGHLIVRSLRHFADHRTAGVILVLFLAALEFGLGQAFDIWQVRQFGQDGLSGNRGLINVVTIIVSLFLTAVSVFVVGVWAGKPLSTSPNSKPRWIVLGLWYLALKTTAFATLALLVVLQANLDQILYQLGAAYSFSNIAFYWGPPNAAVGVIHVTLALILSPFLLKLVAAARNDRRVPVRYFSRRTLALALTACFALAVLWLGKALLMMLGFLAAKPFLNAQGSGYFLGGASTSWPSLVFISLPQNLWIAFMFLFSVGMLVAAYVATSHPKLGASNEQ